MVYYPESPQQQQEKRKKTVFNNRTIKSSHTKKDMQH
jgi:hypothetical protein